MINPPRESIAPCLWSQTVSPAVSLSPLPQASSMSCCPSSPPASQLGSRTNTNPSTQPPGHISGSNTLHIVSHHLLSCASRYHGCQLYLADRPFKLPSRRETDTRYRCSKESLQAVQSLKSHIPLYRVCNVRLLSLYTAEISLRPSETLLRLLRLNAKGETGSNRHRCPKFSGLRTVTHSIGLRVSAMIRTSPLRWSSPRVGVWGRSGAKRDSFDCLLGGVWLARGLAWRGRLCGWVRVWWGGLIRGSGQRSGWRMCFQEVIRTGNRSGTSRRRTRNNITFFASPQQPALLLQFTPSTDQCCAHLLTRFRQSDLIDDDLLHFKDLSELFGAAGVAVGGFLAIQVVVTLHSVGEAS